MEVIALLKAVFTLKATLLVFGISLGFGVIVGGLMYWFFNASKAKRDYDKCMKVLASCTEYHHSRAAMRLIMFYGDTYGRSENPFYIELDEKVHRMFMFYADQYVEGVTSE